MHMYVIDYDGNRIICRHPSESQTVIEILGKDCSIEKISNRTGFNSYCICLTCHHQFVADFGEASWSPFESAIIRYDKPKPRVEPLTVFGHKSYYCYGQKG